MMLNEPIIIDNTKRSQFRQCKKKYFLSSVKGVQSNFGSTAIRYGVTWHGIMEGFYTFVKANGWPANQDSLNEAMTAGLALGVEKWKKESATKTYNEDYKNFNTAVNAFNSYLEYFKEDSNYVNLLS